MIAQGCANAGMGSPLPHRNNKVAQSVAVTYWFLMSGLAHNLLCINHIRSGALCSLRKAAQHGAIAN
jgi:hypothetical protein